MARVVCPALSYCKNYPNPCTLHFNSKCEFSHSYDYICSFFISRKSVYCSSFWYRNDINVCYDCDPFDLPCCLYCEDSKHG